MSLFLRDKLRASGIHMLISLGVAALAAALVFGLWYPYPYREISGGRSLFVMLTLVDVIMGPLLTLVVYNARKSLREKLLDFSIIGLLQLAALGYGLWTVAQARPVYLAFAFDRFNVVHAVDVEPETLSAAPPELQQLPWDGPKTIAVRPLSVHEQMEVTLAELQGAPAAARPLLWQPYAAARDRVLHASHPATTLYERFADQKAALDAAVQASGRPVAELRYLPLAGPRGEYWTVLLDAQSAEVRGFLPIDSF